METLNLTSIYKSALKGKTNEAEAIASAKENLKLELECGMADINSDVISGLKRQLSAVKRDRQLVVDAKNDALKSSLSNPKAIYAYFDADTALANYDKQIEEVNAEITAATAKIERIQKFINTQCADESAEGAEA